MFNFKKDPNEVALDAEIAQVLFVLKNSTATSEEYSAAADQLVKLVTLKKETAPSWRPSPDALVGAIGSILGIVFILHHEKLNVISSKAISFVTKMK